MIQNKIFNHVSYAWDENEAALCGKDEVALMLYRSNLLGSDLRLTNYGGGNTSCKIFEKDKLTELETEIMYIKGSGGDLGTLKRNGLAALYVEKLKNLKNIYKGLEFEDEMVDLYLYCLSDINSKAPSIDTPLHGFLPFAHIDHLHPDAAIAIAASKDGKKINEKLFNGEIGWVDWQRPGFDLGLKLKDCLDKNPKIKGILLGSHGLFTWGNTSYESYINTLEVIEKYSEYLNQNYGKKSPVFGGHKIDSLSKEGRLKQASLIAPILRGFCSSQNKMIGHFSDDEKVLEFINSHDLEKLAPLGTSCPDHFLRTKIAPLVLNLSANDDLSNSQIIKDILSPLFENYRELYTSYYEKCKHPNSPKIRDKNPVVILYPGVGMFTFAKDKQTARVAAEFYTNAINVMKGAEAVSDYVSLPLQEAFNIEYWLLEEAKLSRMAKPKPLSGKVAIITGSAGGIGKAIAQKFINEGACVMINDNDSERLNNANLEFKNAFGNDSFSSEILDVLDNDSIENCYLKTCLYFGGIDIIVNCAGISISKPLEETTENDWDLLYNILVKGQFLVSKKGVEILRKQGFGGDIVNIVSKNALVSGPNNVAYGSAKAAQLHASRLMAAELGADKIRVNVVNPDAVIADSKIWAGAWAEGRAKAYGITVEELPAFYSKRTLLGEVILPEDVANAVFAFTSGLLNKSTGNVLNVDGGVAMAFVR